MHSSVRFILAGQIEEVVNGDPTRTVLEYLREQKGLCGTKEGCAEGDCGACTVVIGELHGEGMRYQAVNSCIQFLPSLDGKQLICVEDLATPGNQSADVQLPGIQLHAVQQAMVDQHGSQCGFCTPGFVMSLFSMFHHQPDQAITREQTELGLAGNLCRCTGYAPIVRAAEQALTAGRTDRFSQQESERIAQLNNIQSNDCLSYTESAHADLAGTKSSGAANTYTYLRNEIDGSPGHEQRQTRTFYSPRSLQTLCELLHEHPNATMVAGATDVGLWVTKKLQRLETIIYLGKVDELKQLDDDGKHLTIGAGVTYADASDRLCALYPGFQTLINRLGGAQVRNAGTIGGNIANGSPIGDMPPALIALGARLVLCSVDGQREIDLEDFFIKYGKQDLRAGECVQQIKLPKPSESQRFATYKISKRIEQDISALCSAFALQVEDGQITHARVCFGGMAGTPKRALHCENVLIGRPFVQETINAAMQAILDDYTPMSDMRASANYRMQVAQNLLQRFYLEHSDVNYPVRLEGNEHA